MKTTVNVTSKKAYVWLVQRQNFKNRYVPLLVSYFQNQNTNIINSNINWADTQGRKLSLLSQFLYIMTCIFTLQSHHYCHQVMIWCDIWLLWQKVQANLQTHVSDTMPYKMLRLKTIAKCAYDKLSVWWCYHEVTQRQGLRMGSENKRQVQAGWNGKLHNANLMCGWPCIVIQCG